MRLKKCARSICSIQILNKMNLIIDIGNTSTKLAVFQRDKVLIAKRSDGKYRGFWEFPGGKVKKDEIEETEVKKLHMKHNVS